jgi:hypothetical protein
MLDLALNGKFTKMHFESSNKNPRMSIGYLLSQINDGNLKSKLVLLLDINPDKRVMVYNSLS